MTQKEIAEFKLKCLQLAQQANPNGSADTIVKEAQKLYDWMNRF